MAGEAEKYLTAKAQFERINSDLSATIETMRQAYGALGSNPAKFAFSNITGSGLPAEAIMSHDSVSIDANQWPTPVKIMEILSRWHSARDSVRSAWAAVPVELQSGLVPPQGHAALPSSRGRFR